VIEFDDLDATDELRFNAVARSTAECFRHLRDEGRGRSHHIRQRAA
jgi:hypothetical protein